jgi:RimJ/RimL family protein N-acetyltransferase
MTRNAVEVPDVAEAQPPGRAPEAKPGSFVVRLPIRPRLPLRTERLVLRRFEPSDLPALLAYHRLPEATRYVPFEPRTPESTARVLELKMSCVSLADAGDHIDLAVTLDGTLIGDVLLFLESVPDATLEIGYMFDPAYAGQGYATEAAAALLDLAFGEVGAHRVVARIDPRNAASVAVCERLGMRQEAHLIESSWIKGEWRSELNYGILDHEWAARRA